MPLEAAAQAVAQESVTVGQRAMPVQPFAAVTVHVEPLLDEYEPDLRITNEQTELMGRQLHDTLTEAGIAPTGPFWTTLGVNGETLRVVLHWPLAATVDLAQVQALARGVRCATLPERTEAFVEIPLPENSGDESVQLALAALLSASGARQPDLRTLRQTMFGNDGRLEFAISLGAPS